MEAFQELNVHRVADVNEQDIEELTKDERVIRNQRKLEAIVGNARKMIAFDEDYGPDGYFLFSLRGRGRRPAS